MARVRLRELSFGRSASAKKVAAGVADAVTSFRPRIPLNFRGVEVEMRVPPPPARLLRQSGGQHVLDPSIAFTAPPRATANAAQADAGDGAAERQQTGRQALALAKRATAAVVAAARWIATHAPPLPVQLPLRLASGALLQLILALLPSVPVRVKEIDIRFEVGLTVSE